MGLFSLGNVEREGILLAETSILAALTRFLCLTLVSAQVHQLKSALHDMEEVNIAIHCIQLHISTLPNFPTLVTYLPYCSYLFIIINPLVETVYI